MARYIHLEAHLSADELARRYRGTKDPVERSHWHFLWLLARGFTAKVFATITGYSVCTGSARSLAATMRVGLRALKTNDI
jgi:hypothetical protein